MPDFTIKQGDTKPPIQVQLKNADGSITDLTGSSVDIHIKDKIDVVVIDIPMSIVGAENNGTVEWDPTIVLSDIIGRYRVEFEVTFPDSKIHTFPNSNEGMTLEVVKKIA